jgi:hypothetical protein
VSRAHIKDGKLRGCPVCGTRVAQADIGLRDFSWVNEALPGRLGLMDIDGCLTQAATGRALMLELKPKGQVVSRGALLTYQLFWQKGIDVWLVQDEGDGQATVAELYADDFLPAHTLAVTELAEKVREWWDEGLQ